MALIKGKYKKTELGFFPDDWNLLCIPEIVIKKDGMKIGPFGSQLKKELLSEYGYKVYGQENVFEKDMEIGSRFLTKEHFISLKTCELLKGDFIISMMGTIGKCMIVPAKFQQGIMDSHLLRLRLNEKIINSVLLLHFFSSKILLDQVFQLSVGGIMNGLSSTIIKKILIPIPPTKTEQTAIATSLSDIDELITSLEKLISKKKMIKQGAMQKLLKTKKDWESKKMEDIAYIGRGRVISHREIESSIFNVYPVYSSQTSNNGIMGYINTYDFEGEYATWTTDGVNAGTVFYRNGKFNCTNVCGTIKIKKDNAMFVSLILNTITPQYVSKNLANPKLMNDIMKKIEIPLPPLNEQNDISQTLIDMEAEIKTLEKKLDKYIMLKQGMMQVLLTGKIRLV